MEVKQCSRCNQILSIEEYTKNSSRKDGLNSACKTCHRKYTRAHYKANKGYYMAKAKRHDRRIRKWIQALKEKPCTDCGKKYPYYVMQFDHLKDKEFELAYGFKYGKEKLAKELAKCEVVCANCHAERTHQRENVRVYPLATNQSKG